jgi:hypothetical protein
VNLSTVSRVDPLAPDTSALPVALDLAGGHADNVRRWTEGVLGWQPIDPDTAELVPAAVRLVDLAGSVVGRGTGRGTAGAGRAVPSVLLVADADAPVQAAEVAARERPDLVLAWPAAREGLHEAVTAMLAAERATGTEVRTLRIGGASGGVGTSTVALALAGLASWSGASTLVAVGHTAPVDGARVVSGAALAAPDLWRRASPLAGVPRARVVRIADTEPLPDPVAPELEVAILDAGVATDVDLLVCRADAAGLDAATATTAAAVVVVGEGPASAGAVRAACRSRQQVVLPRSARVARAGLHRRVPTALPGAWLRLLAPLVPAGPATAPPG